jgi:hypothetical protein
LKSKPFNLLPVCPRNNLGGGLNLKTFLSRFKDLSSKKNKKKSRKREGREKGGSTRHAVEKTKKQGQSGKRVWADPKRPFDSPEN